MPLKLCILGTEYIDIVLYLARIMIALGKQVVIIDNSMEKNLAYCIPSVEGALDKIEYRGISIMRNQDWNVCVDSCDIAIYIYADTIQPKALQQANQVIVITDQHLYHLAKLRPLLYGLNGKVHLLIKNYVAGKVDKDSMLNTLGLTMDQIDSFTLLPLDQINTATSFMAEYNYRFRFDQLSKEYRHILLELIEQLYQEKIEEKALVKAMKRAERGA